MTYHVLLPATLSILFAGAAFAVEPTLGANLGTNIKDISAALSLDGYELTKYEKEGNRIEVYAVKDDARHELYLDASSGKVTRMETTARRGPSTLPGVNDDQVRASLHSLGYDVTGYKREQGEIEVYANKDGRRWELKIDPRTGGIVKSEAED